MFTEDIHYNMVNYVNYLPDFWIQVRPFSLYTSYLYYLPNGQFHQFRKIWYVLSIFNQIFHFRIYPVQLIQTRRESKCISTIAQVRINK